MKKCIICKTTDNDSLFNKISHGLGQSLDKKTKIHTSRGDNNIECDYCNESVISKLDQVMTKHPCVVEFRKLNKLWGAGGPRRKSDPSKYQTWKPGTVITNKIRAKVVAKNFHGALWRFANNKQLWKDISPYCRKIDPIREFIKKAAANEFVDIENFKSIEVVFKKDTLNIVEDGIWYNFRNNCCIIGYYQMGYFVFVDLFNPKQNLIKFIHSQFDLRNVLVININMLNIDLRKSKIIG